MSKVSNLSLDLGILLPHRFLDSLELAHGLLIFGRHLADVLIFLAQLVLERSLGVPEQVCLQFESPGVLVLGHDRGLVQGILVLELQLVDSARSLLNYQC